MYHGIVLYCITVGLKFSFRNTEKTKELFLEKQLVSIINHQLGLKPGLMWFRRFTDRWSVGHSVRRRSFHYMKHPHGFSRDFVMIFKPKWRNLTLSGAQRESGRGVDPENTGSSLQESNQLVKGSAFCTEHYFPPLPPHPLLLPPPPLLFFPHWAQKAAAHTETHNKKQHPEQEDQPCTEHGVYHEEEDNDGDDEEDALSRASTPPPAPPPPLSDQSVVRSSSL